MAECDIEIMGQKFSYPKTLPGTLGLIAFLAALVSCVFFVIQGVELVILRGDPKTLAVVASLFSTKTIDKTEPGKPLQVEESTGRLIQFWTPSADTQLFLTKSSNGQVSDDEEWQVTTEAHVDDFENRLLAKFRGNGETHIGTLNGLRRYETVGHGRTAHKKGWWWVMNVTKDFDEKELAKFYFAFWRNSKSLYLEELNGETRYQGGS